MIRRTIEGTVESLIGSKKAIIIMGARQVGESILLHNLLGQRSDVLWLNGDDDDVMEMFREISSTRLKAVIGSKGHTCLGQPQKTRCSRQTSQSAGFTNWK